MENLVPLGTGNSRLMKSNIPSNTTLAQLIQMWNNGTFPYDIGPLNSAGISQQGTPLNKDTLLNDTTAALYGLDSDAVPDDVLNILSRFQNGLGNEYLWIKNKYSVNLGQGTSKNIYYVAVLDPGSRPAYHINYSASADGLVNGNYSTIVTTDYSSPSELANAVKSAISGKYFTTDCNIYETPNQICYAGSSVNVFVESDVDIAVQPVTIYPNSDVSLLESSYVNAPSPDAYPPAVSDGNIYTALGQLGNKVQIATGSYVGTGTYGSGNPNTLTFDFEPKIVFLARDGSEEILGNYAGHITVFPWTAYLTFRSGSSGYRCTINWNGNTISWYSTSDATSQGNVSGTTYYYLAIG